MFHLQNKIQQHLDFQLNLQIDHKHLHHFQFPRNVYLPILNHGLMPSSNTGNQLRTYKKASKSKNPFRYSSLFYEDA